MFSDMPKPVGDGNSGVPIPTEVEKIFNAHEYPSTTTTFTLQSDYYALVAVTSNPSGYIFTHNGVTLTEYPMNYGVSNSSGFIVLGNFKAGDTITYRCSQGGEYYIGLYGIK